MMCANKADIYNSISIINGYYQSIMISFDIKNNSIICHDASIPIIGFYFSR